MFGGVGIFFVILGLFLLKKHRNFVSQCITVEGKVIDIVDKQYITRGSFGQVTKRRIIKTPIVLYKYHKRYKFQAEIDARYHNLSLDSVVEVLINPLRPRTAKLRIGATENTTAFYIMIGLGVFSSIIGVVLFNPNEFNLDFLYTPFALGIITVTIVFLYLKLWPLLSILPHAPIYTENAEEIKEQD